ncbi:1-deoxy-D-xylulose-5-phosphate reductoisomerase, partial [Aliiglaciecola sp.]|nr:1-deoxy-D-xylulose-5-phosphate reductoisomerase [Aliiglaciecola sp.]
NSGVKPLDFTDIVDFSFQLPDFNRYPNLQIAIEACEAGQYATTALNAVNEMTVAAFLSGDITFNQIAQINHDVVQHISSRQLTSIEAVLELDTEVRALSKQYLQRACA